MARILIADDEQSIRDLLVRALEGEGHAVTTASDGAEALSQFEAGGGAFDVLIADVDMPQMDGVTLAGKVVAASPATAVIIMSGIADELARAQSINGVHVRLLSKPVTLEQIRQEVRAALSV